MKHIGIVGSFGSGNLGDEAAWISVKQFLCRKDPRYKYHTHKFQWSVPYQVCTGGVYKFYNFKPAELDWINENFEAFIVTGGGIVGNKWGFIKTPGLDKLLDKLTVPIYVVSVSAEDESYDSYMVDVLKKLVYAAKIFTVRDGMSQAVIEKLTGFKPEITPDIVTIMESAPENQIYPEKFSERIFTMASNDLNKDYLKFFSTVFSGIGGEEYYTAIPFSPTANDINLVQLMRGKVYFQLYQPEEMQTVISKAKFIVAGRLHGAVFAANTGTPFFAINYHPKVKEFCDSIGYPHYWPRDGTDLALDGTNYGYDFTKLDPSELIGDIIEFVRNHPNPKVTKGMATEILERVWNDIFIQKEVTRAAKEIAKEIENDVVTLPCMYCGGELYIVKHDKFTECPHCKNVNHNDDVSRQQTSSEPSQ